MSSVRYQMSPSGKFIIDTERNIFIPVEATYHRYWQEYQEWLDEGNTPLPPEESTTKETLAKLTQAVQNHMDQTARERMYDGILSLCTYATSTNPKFALEGQAGVNWRDACWAVGYALMDAVLKGERPIPSVEELIAELPPFSWPDA